MTLLFHKSKPNWASGLDIISTKKCVTFKSCCFKTFRENTNLSLSDPIRPRRDLEMWRRSTTLSPCLEVIQSYKYVKFQSFDFNNIWENLKLKNFCMEHIPFVTVIAINEFMLLTYTFYALLPWLYLIYTPILICELSRNESSRKKMEKIRFMSLHATRDTRQAST